MPTKNFGNQTLQMPAHDNARGGLQVAPGAAPKALTKGANVGKRHGKACESHGMQDEQSRISQTRVISEDERDAQTYI